MQAGDYPASFISHESGAYRYHFHFSGMNPVLILRFMGVLNGVDLFEN
jgi:hypothetical protein